MSPEQLWAKRRFLFGKMWEDSAVERGLFERLVGQGRVLSIASAGDTALHLAGATGSVVQAIDINPGQIHLCRLKLALLRSMRPPDFARLLVHDARSEARQVLSSLPPDSAEFWRDNLSLLEGGTSRAGRVDRLMAWWLRLFHFFLLAPDRCERFLQLDQPEHQVSVFEREWTGRRWRAAFRLILNPALLALVYGREFVKQLPSDLESIMRLRMEAFLTRTPARNNPYLWQTFAPSRIPPVLPPYLADWGEVSFSVGSLESLSSSDRFDFFHLSNILEVAGQPQIERLKNDLQARAQPGAIVVLRFMCPRAPVWPEFQFLNEESRAASELDRAFFCNHFQVYRIP